MSIKPPSDIVLDVARAADPAKSLAATERLMRIGNDPSDAEVGFSNVLGGLQAPIENSAILRTQFMHASPHAQAMTEKVDPKTKAYQGLEALVLQNLVETMMPQGEEFFGEGSAGSIWKSMLARELGTELAKKIDFGLVPKHGPRTHAGQVARVEAGESLDHSVPLPLPLTKEP